LISTTIVPQQTEITQFIFGHPLREQGSRNLCLIDHDVSLYNVGDLSVEADVFVFEPLKVTAIGFPPDDCYVAGYSGHDKK
jgi:hypothetical protein